MHDTGGDTVDLIIFETKDGEGVVVKQQLLTIIDNLDNDDLRGEHGQHLIGVGSERPLRASLITSSTSFLTAFNSDSMLRFWLMTAVFFVCNTVDFELHLQVVEVGLRHGPLHVK